MLLEVLLSALALMCIFEGFWYFAFPELTRRMLAYAVTRPSGSLRIAGFSMIAVGVIILTLVDAFVK